MLVDEPEEDETEADAERDQGRLSPESEKLLKSLNENFEAEKAAGEKVGDDEEKSSSGSKESDVDAETDQWIKSNYDPRDRLIKRKRKRSADDDKDETYVPSPEHVQDVQTPPSAGRRKSTSRKHVQSPAARKLKIKLKTKPTSEPQNKQPSPPHQSPTSEPQPKSPPKQPSPPQQRQPSPDILQSIQFSPQLHISPPIHQQPPITSPHILQTPPTTQPQVQTTPGSSGFNDFPPIPEDISLEKIGDFNFVTDHVVKKLQKKMDDVLTEKKKLEKHVKTVEAENSSLLKRVEADQADIDILKVRIVELEEDKARRDEQNEYFKLKNKELEANNTKKV
ncbi:bromodomain-containing protein 4-like [Helianthus annuus]|uniref:bromodomain-containing protein 4-like n=1 Tax=Helianthus annuus TaxID=4232 RepID=UPI000B907F40|nr:bromodomain-containing protein 4-like [Helianthus annuus]